MIEIGKVNFQFVESRKSEFIKLLILKISLKIY